MSGKGQSEIDALMDEDATDDRCVFAVIDGSVTVERLKAIVDRLELEAEARGYDRGYNAAYRRYAPPLP